MSQIKVYQPGRLRPAAAALVFAALAAAGVFISSERPLAGWAVAVGFACAAVLALASTVLGGPKLTLGRKGFELAGTLHTRRIRWDEIAAPQVGKLQRAEVIAIQYLPGKRPRTLSHAITGMDLAIGRGYGVPLDALCRTMNEYRERFLSNRAQSHRGALSRSSRGEGSEERGRSRRSAPKAA